VPTPFRRGGPGTAGAPLPDLPSGRQLVFAATELTFNHLPAALAADLGFLCETRLADCRHLVRVGTEAGLTVHPVSGLFLSVPFSNLHSWIEMEAAGRRLTAVPFFLTTRGRWGVLDPAEWPAERCPLGAYWPLGAYERPLLTHRETPVHVSLMT